MNEFEVYAANTIRLMIKFLKLDDETRGYLISQLDTLINGIVRRQNTSYNEGGDMNDGTAGESETGDVVQMDEGQVLDPRAQG